MQWAEGCAVKVFGKYKDSFESPEDFFEDLKKFKGQPSPTKQRTAANIVPFLIFFNHLIDWELVLALCMQQREMP